MGPLSLKTLAILQVLRRESKFDHRPPFYRKICCRIMDHMNDLRSFSLNQIIGSRRWFLIMEAYLLFREAHFTRELDDIDKDILNWCTQSLDIIPDYTCKICHRPAFESDEYYGMCEYKGVCKCACTCDYPLVGEYVCEFCDQIVINIHMIWKGTLKI